MARLKGREGRGGEGLVSHHSRAEPGPGVGLGAAGSRGPRPRPASQPASLREGEYQPLQLKHGVGEQIIQTN